MRINLKEVAVKGLGFELANNAGVVGRYLYHQGYSLEDIARAYGMTKSELLLAILIVVQEVRGTKFIEKIMIPL